jgi:hypothetical protein
MKTILLFISFLLLQQFSFSQNLISNPSFEISDTCPNTISQIKLATGWWDARPSGDYFNVCAPYFPHPINCVAVPLNSFGYRTPASGNCYAGIISIGGINEDRECLGSQLITPLQIGTRYYASFKVSLIGEMYQPNRCGINKLGILFSTLRYDSISPAPICSNCEQIYSDSIIIDTLNWTRIKGSFIADSNYSYITIGRLNFNSLTDSIQLSGTLCIAYYFIDDVCVSTDSVYSYNYTWTGINDISKENIVTVFPNPATTLLTITTTSTQPSQIILYDIASRELMEERFSGSATLNIKNLAKGVYLYQVRDEKGIVKQGKVVKE